MKDQACKSDRLTFAEWLDKNGIPVDGLKPLNMWYDINLYDLYEKEILNV